MTADTRPEGAERPELDDDVAEAVQARREALHEAADHLEGELDAVAAQDRPDTGRLRDAVHAMRATLRAHAEGAEAPDGPLADIIGTAPWLANRAARQRDEHHELLARATALVERADAGEAVTTLVDDARQLLARVTAHRHHATTLLLDAYTIDIAAGD